MRRLLVVALAAGSLLTACGGPPAAVLHLKAADFQIRPVLCGALAFSGRGDASSPHDSRPPPCDDGYELSAANNRVAPDPNSPAGYTVAVVAPDPKFISVRSTPSRLNLWNWIVLLPGPPASGQYARYVLGPAGLSTSSIADASAAQNNLGDWVVYLTLTRAGSLQWDRMSRMYFHDYAALVVNDVVITAPLVEPTSAQWSSFDGRIEISASLSKSTAQRLAAEL
jgi:hypothetical protein